MNSAYAHVSVDSQAAAADDMARGDEYLSAELNKQEDPL